MRNWLGKWFGVLSPIIEIEISNFWKHFQIEYVCIVILENKIKGLEMWSELFSFQNKIHRWLC